MKRFNSIPAWSAFKQKLKENYRHLTDADLAAIENNEDEWLEKLQRVVGRSAFEIAQVAEEVADEQNSGLNPVWLAFARNEESRSRHLPGVAAFATDFHSH